MADRVRRSGLVTGGAQGIGKAVARRLLEDGMAVTIVDCDAEACEETVAELSAAGDIAASVGDVSEEEHVRRAVDDSAKRFGRLDVLICNAGLSGGFGVPVTDLPLDQWRRVIDVNLTGCFLFAKYAAPLLRRQGGSIVTIASTRAVQSEAHTEAYSASKGGIVALTHALAVSLGPEIRVNCISPGWIETGDWKKRSDRRTPRHSPQDRAQHPAGRVGRPEDIAAMAAFLVSEAAGFVTAQDFIVDGGMTRKMIYVP
jgi:NAD(P)-dependent dehydrogenase (short-subunit alcohol dehydrogenase family)